ncbi:MAG: hypothetical protein WBP93_19620 [Pyrinomonadaceae bacterium]
MPATIVSVHSFKLFVLLLTMLFLSRIAAAQSANASVTMSGSVSGTVALSLAPNAQTSGSGVQITSASSHDHTLTITLSGNTRHLTELEIPLHIRSNTGYKLSATARARGATLSSLLVVSARPTGKLVAADSVEALGVARMFDGRLGIAQSHFGMRDSTSINLSSPVELLSGPRVSLGGTMISHDNALEVILSVVVEPQTGSDGWIIELVLPASTIR